MNKSDLYHRSKAICKSVAGEFVYQCTHSKLPKVPNARSPGDWPARLPKLAVGFGTTVVTVGITGLTQISDAATTPPPTVYEMTKNRVAEMGLGDAVAVQQDEAGSILVEGHVSNSDQGIALRDAIAQLPQPVQQRVWSGDELIAEAKAVLKELRLSNVTLTHHGSGRLSASGYVADPAHWERARQTLVADHPGIVAVEDTKIQTESDRTAIAQAMLVERGWDDRIYLSTQRGELVLDGHLAPNQTQGLERLLRQLRHRFNGQPRVVSKVAMVEIEESPSAPSTVITGVVISPRQRIAIAQDGSRYMPGDRLPDNSVISAIKLGTVEVEREGQIYVYRL